MRKIVLLIAAVAISPLIFAQDNNAVIPSGFLSHYDKLVPDPRSSDNYFHYSAPAPTKRKVGKIYFLPLTTFPENKEFEVIDRVTVDAMLSKLDEVLRKKLAGKATLVNTAEEADTIVQIAATGAKTIDASRDVIDYIPLRLVTKPLKDAAMGKQQQVVVTLEMMMRDATTHEPVFEAIHHTAGKNIGRTGDAKLQANIDALRPVVDKWTDNIVKEIISPQ